MPAWRCDPQNSNPRTALKIRARNAKARSVRDTLGPGELSAELMRDEGSHAAASQARVILYLEDDDPTAYLFEKVVRELNSTVLLYRVLDCASAIAFLKQEAPFVGVARPHVLVLDLHVPGGSGFDVLKAVRGNPTFSRLPVIIFTSSNAASDRNEARQNHADGYLLKSADLSAFTSAAQMALRLAA
jgi:CheY-like chemotaxis protein